jgi:hypothetical protein
MIKFQHWDVHIVQQSTSSFGIYLDMASYRDAAKVGNCCSFPLAIILNEVTVILCVRLKIFQVVW